MSPLESGRSAGPAVSHLGGHLQLGFFVSDVAASMREWTTAMGVKPFVHIGERTIDITYDGQPRSLRQTHAFGFLGDVQIELIQQVNHEIPSPYRDFMAGGQHGLNHLGFWSDETELAWSRLEAAGYPSQYVVDINGQIIKFYESKTLGTAIEVIPAERKAFRDALLGYLAACDQSQDVHVFATLDDFWAAVG